MCRIGVLDLCRHFGGDQAAAIWSSIEIGQVAERLGYDRYWVAEHHTPDVAHSSPELIVAAIAGTTSRIRVGTAGVLMRFRQPFRVAKDFRVLESIFSGRIDLGLARGGVDPEIQVLLTGNSLAADDYADRVTQLVRLLRGESRIPANPLNIAPPQIWILGSNVTSMRLAAACGTAFCLAQFLDGAAADGPAIVREYRKSFIPTAQLQAPQWSVAVAGICDLSNTLASGTAANYGKGVRASLLGDIETCRVQLRTLLDEYQCEEVIWLEMSRDIAARERSLRLMAEAAGFGVTK